MIIRHFKFWTILLALILAFLVIYSGITLYIGSCSYRNNCLEAGRAELAHTPMPTLIPATLQPISTVISVPSSLITCTVTAETLLSIWVSSDFSESQPFQFTDLNNTACEASFADVQPLFTQSNVWYPGAVECISCHNANLSPASSAGLDLSSYAGVVAGSQRSAGSTSGQDILGGGDWGRSKLNQVLFVLHQMPYQAPPNVVPAAGPTILAGLPVSVISATPTMTTTEVEIARPNTPGGSGDAINFTGDAVAGEKIFVDNCQMCHGPEGTNYVLNPGSDDGTVPSLNPIDETLVSSDYMTYAYNVDLFIQNGSRPAGVNPARWMPPWGTQNGLNQQQIADAIAYIINLNK
jgi:mono/diheme cytochrome c family protein